MREIKFRGKAVYGNKWVYGYYVRGCTDGSGFTFDVGIKPPMCYPVEVIPSTVGQYTGLKDKNGKEIWEGDILNYKRTGDNWDADPGFDKDYEITVGFKNGSFICAETDRPLYEYIKSVSSFRLDQWTTWEIIGSVFDNPELLTTPEGIK